MTIRECKVKSYFKSRYMTRPEPWEYQGRRDIQRFKVKDIEFINETTTVLGVTDENNDNERCFVIKDEELNYPFADFIKNKFSKDNDYIRFLLQREVNDDRLPWIIIGFITDLGHEGGRTTFTN